MEKYLKIGDYFGGDLSVSSGTRERIVSAKGEVVATTPSPQVARLAVHAINSHDELVSMNKELLAVVNNFHITEPDEDGCVWLVLNGIGTTGMAMFNLGNGGRIAAKVALHLESDRKAAIAKAKAAS